MNCAYESAKHTLTERRGGLCFKGIEGLYGMMANLGAHHEPTILAISLNLPEEGLVPARLGSYVAVKENNLGRGTH